MRLSTPLVHTVRYLRGLLAVLCVLGSFVAGTAVGQTLWEENGHYYLIVEQETTWQQARLLAESMMFMGVQGHLATITSEAENMFVTTHLGDTAGAWLGGQQPPGSSEPEGGWGWLTGEPWVYTNWDAGEPNNTYFGGWGKDATGQSEERLQYHHNGTHWNDLPDDPEVVTPRFIIEWDVSTEACVPPPVGLVSWWPGDENAQDIIGSNDGTLQGGTTFAPGMVGQAFSFDGVNSFVQAPTANLPTGNNDRTLELWVNLEAVVAEEAFFAGYGAFGVFDQAYVLGATGDTLFFSQWGEAIFGPSLQIGQWHHVAVSNIGNSATLYLDGTVVASNTLPINTPSDTQFFMGRIPGELGDIRRLQGLVDEGSIYNRALSAEEIAAIFNAGRAGKCKDTEVQEVTIDIKPGSALNRIHPKSHEVIRVAILTTDTLDATSVDPRSVRFGPKGAKAMHQKGHIKDVNHDGKPDLILHFKIQATGIQCGENTASLTGETFDGDPIRGSDAIQTVGCKK